jgi:hypothetical protein
MATKLIFAPSASAQDEMTVSIQDFFFDPDQLTVDHDRHAGRLVASRYTWLRGSLRPSAPRCASPVVAASSSGVIV